MRTFYYIRDGRLRSFEMNLKRVFFLFLIFVLIPIVLAGIGFSIFTGQIIAGTSQRSDYENRLLRTELKKSLEDYKSLNDKMQETIKSSDELRVMADLPLLQSAVGTGGSSFRKIYSYGDMNWVIKGIDSYSDRLQAELNLETKSFEKIEGRLIQNQKLFASIPAIKPADGPYGDSFGMRNHPILKIVRMHNGQDLVVPEGTPVYAPGAGVVIASGNNGGFGLSIEINHGFGYLTIFGHLSSLVVRNGQKVRRGDLIAFTGNSGLSTGPHLHYEVRHDGVALNPRDFIYDDVKAGELTNNKNL